MHPPSLWYKGPAHKHTYNSDHSFWKIHLMSWFLDSMGSLSLNVLVLIWAPCRIGRTGSNRKNWIVLHEDSQHPALLPVGLLWSFSCVFYSTGANILPWASFNWNWVAPIRIWSLLISCWIVIDCSGALLNPMPTAFRS